MNPPLRINKTPYEDPEQEKHRNRLPPKTLLKQNLESYKVSFTLCERKIYIQKKKKN